MIRFISDYQEGCIPEILCGLAEYNSEKNEGYGMDAHSKNAARLIRAACDAPEASVHFVATGTLANLTVISACLKNYQGVISHTDGHIATHEAGAIEHAGHKVLTIGKSGENDGKLTAAMIEDYMVSYNENLLSEHCVMPGMVYISQSTEKGTVYSLEELRAISGVCKKYGLVFYIDGARLLYALSSKSCDFSLADIALLSDVFYIGGTKAGALYGEAVVISNTEINRGFRRILRQSGTLIAKGMVLGIQFEKLMTGENYKKYCDGAVREADRIREVLINKGIKLAYPGSDTQIFALFSKKQYDFLLKRFEFGPPDKKGEFYEVRICTSWATEPSDVNKLIYAVNMLEN